MINSIKPNELEESTFPAEFLDCFTATAFKTLYDYLEKAGAPQDAIDLFDSAWLLLKESGELARTGGKVPHATNQVLSENVADASRCIVALGGVFYAPDGASLPREEVPFQWALNVTA
jgi:hypothetical protein